MTSRTRTTRPAPEPQVAIPTREAVLGLLAEHELHCAECAECRKPVTEAPKRAA